MFLPIVIFVLGIQYPLRKSTLFDVIFISQQLLTRIYNFIHNDNNNNNNKSNNGCKIFLKGHGIQAFYTAIIINDLYNADLYTVNLQQPGHTSSFNNSLYCLADLHFAFNDGGLVGPRVPFG